jgi:hypothetical protein
MNTELILSLIKVSLEVFQDERKDRFLKKYLKIQEDYQNELNKGLDNRSDLKLMQLLGEAEQLGELVVRERSSGK